MTIYSIAVLGGYGLFGSRIVQRLAQEPGWRVLVGGRSRGEAERSVSELRRDARTRAKLVALPCDVHEPGLRAVLQRANVDLVINACGPFQGQDYAVARAVLAAGAHYVDLADARGYVTGFGALDAEAHRVGRLAVCGASTVPGLSAAVVDRYRGEFGRLLSIDIGISPGNRTPRGLATVAAILGYVGQPLPWRENDRPHSVTGWQRLQRWRYPAPAGPRWLAACDVPDLGLFADRYPHLHTLRFRAGLELKRLHFGLWLLSWLVRARILRDLDRHARFLKSASELFVRSGSDSGAMHVDLRGVGVDGKALRIVWQLVAAHGDGPQIPATAAVLLARKLAGNRIDTRGATACVDLFTLDEFIGELEGYAISTAEDRC